MRRSVFLALFLLCISPAYALDDIQGVSAVWNDFVSSLRRGDYVNAHGLFSAQSRAAMPYREFVAEYGPLSPAREMVLAKPDSQATNLDGDWAEIAYGGTNPGTGRKFKVGVSFVKNQGRWGLVAARNETAERVEAGARSMLRLLWDNRMHGAPRDLLTALSEAQAGNPVLRYYRLETNGETFRAFPLDKALRTFYVDNWGEVRPVEQDPATTRRTSGAGGMAPIPDRSSMPQRQPAPAANASSPASNSDAMPELSDPGDWDATGLETLDNEFPEPPMPGQSAPRTPSAPPALSLPDTIR